MGAHKRTYLWYIQVAFVTAASLVLLHFNHASFDSAVLTSSVFKPSLPFFSYYNTTQQNQNKWYLSGVSHDLSTMPRRDMPVSLWMRYLLDVPFGRTHWTP